jgi:hypothetical protein
MGEALNKFEEESNKTVAREDILDYLAFSTYKQGIMNSHTVKRSEHFSVQIERNSK